MDSFEEFVPLFVAFLHLRPFQLEFRVSHAFFRRPTAEGDDLTPEDSDSDESIDSQNQQFLLSEEAVMSTLAGQRWKSVRLAPELRVSVARCRNTAYFSGLLYDISTLSALAAVNKTWLSACVMQVSGRCSILTFGLYEASILRGLKVKTLRNSHDGLIAQFSGRISRNLKWCKLKHPLVSCATTAARSSRDM